MTSVETMEIAIEGIEATQATQFYRSERYLDAVTSERDNAVPLVAGKSLVLRVYPDVKQPLACKENLIVDGELWFRSAKAPGWQASSRFPGIVTGQPSAQIDRGEADQTLNFRIPDRCARETLLVRTRVWINLPGSTKCFSDWCERTFFFVANAVYTLVR